ncbi:transcriptional regulator, DeoR family [Paenibacillus sophorae]|uniref:DeoR/GlpR family DNA-binding transcription regulator n=1 Tax=Paenibacillus sophorae TaxID=1333845 RepID=A0A1H8F892_9BACL|nr:DeoR/GlpR family DNA-binding transcription regulator [Paenibacillus sophorae]QWU13797.1 DeoR/GlpR family DNA-binding transcription regulator [Paenibacillus sophorae]SEN28063.1 transcriptional regulator, DeoR family [Paenibacillus sophorae]
MLVEERHQSIINQLNTEGSVKVKDLSVFFKVTEDCIRKDLAHLEKQNLLKRTYGGAVLPRQNIHSFEVVKRKVSNIEAKEAIARKALGLINQGDTVFLDISTANIELAKLILQSGKRVTVVTNMIEVIQIYSAASAGSLISVGGTLNPYGDGFEGSFCIDNISRFKFDLSFLGAVGIDVFENSVSTYDVADGLTKSAVIKSSRKAYLITASDKFNQDGSFRYSGIGDLTGIVTDKQPNPKIVQALSEYNVELY